MPWSIRFRFRISTPLNSDATALSLVIAGREVVISGESNGEHKLPLQESSWLVLSIHGFENKHVAKIFGHRAVHAVLLAGARRGVGIDAGENRAIVSLSQVAADRLAGSGRTVRDNIHGLDVMSEKATRSGKVTIDPSQFLDTVTASFDESANLGEREQNRTSAFSALANRNRTPRASRALSLGGRISLK